MEDDAGVSIEPSYSFRPHAEKRFTVHCHHHRILTTVTSTPSVIRRWTHRIRHFYGQFGRRLVVGLGVQWHPGHLHTAGTLQLCVGQKCLIIQLQVLQNQGRRIPLILRRFLADPFTTFVGIWNYKDQSILSRSKHRIRVSNLIDVRDAAAKIGYGMQISTGSLARLILDLDGVEKDEDVGRSDWETVVLGGDQVMYACLDAFIAFALGKKLQVWGK